MIVKDTRDYVKQEVLKIIMPAILDCDNPIKVGDGEYAVRSVVEGQEIWTTISVKVKNWTDTKKNKAFNPHDKAAEWEAKKKIKEA